MAEDSNAGKQVNWAEKRAHPRYPILVRGTAIPVGVPGAGEFPVVASNVSMGGMVVSGQMGEVVNVHDILRMKFSLLREPPIELQARVVWKRKGVEEAIGDWSFGLLFYNCDEVQILRLHEPARRAFISGLGPESFGMEEG